MLVSLIIEGPGYYHASWFFILGDLCFLSQVYSKHRTLRLYLLATWKLNYCNDTPKANFTLVWQEVQGNSEFGSLKVLLSLLFPSKNVKKKKKSSPLLNCCSLTKMNSPHTKCISSEHRSWNISKLKISKMAAVSLKECIMPEYKISSVTNSILDLLKDTSKVATLNCCTLKWRLKWS